MALAPERIRVRIMYALPDRQVQVDVEIVRGASVADVVAKSGLPDRFQQLAASPIDCAIFGRLATLSEIVTAGDRIEILRPLVVDPKQARRLPHVVRRDRPSHEPEGPCRRDGRTWLD